MARRFTCFLLLVLSLATASHAETLKINHPNIVFLLADDLGWTGLKCFGSDLYETPRLDQLASESMKFTNAYAACTVCSPTRASIMTGMYPARLRLTDFIAGQNRPFAKLRIPNWTKRLESKRFTIAEALKQSGYQTGHFGKWHLSVKDSDESGTLPIDQGFDVSISKPKGSRGYFLNDGVRSREDTNYLTDWLTDHACDFIADRSANRPFFLYFAYNVPHTPIQGRKDLVDYFQAKVDPTETHKNPTYAAMVKSLDLSVGRVLDQIKSSGLAGNTVVIFTSDNGGLTQRNGKHDGFTENLPLRRGKGSAYEGGVRVPTMIHWPGMTKPGSVCEEPIITTDYYPTLLEMLNINGNPAQNEVIDGRSLSPLLESPSAKLSRNLYWHYPHYHAGGDGPYSAVRSGNYRLIRFYEDDSVRLYDLANDIGEQNDLSSQQPEKTRQLAADLEQWLASVDAQLPTKNPNYDADKQSMVKKAKAKRE